MLTHLDRQTDSCVQELETVYVLGKAWAPV